MDQEKGFKHWLLWNVFYLCLSNLFTGMSHKIAGYLALTDDGEKGEIWT